MTAADKPCVALIGRPNVGKSTLFNQITKSRQALVADFSGLTRDRQYAETSYEDKHFTLIDTGGIGLQEANIDNHMATQSYQAIDEADILLFVVDSRAGLVGADIAIAEKIRVLGKPVFVVANKIDGVHEAAPAEFYQLGFGEPIVTAASQNRGIRNLLDVITDDMPLYTPEPIPEGLKMAIIGRPNVGKSTLVNRLLGEERVVVFDMPGTTRDSIYIPYTREGKDYVIIDTAGVRRRGRIDERVEKFSVIKSMQAIKDANVVIMVIDAREGIVDQDMSLLGFAVDNGRAIVIAINKWDGMDDYHKQLIKDDIERRFKFIPYVKVHMISALNGTGVGNLYGSIHRAYKSAMTSVSTNRLTQILQDAVQAHQPPMVNGRRIKLRYAHMGGHNPPVIVVHGNQVEKLSSGYKRYLENEFRTVLKLEGSPLRVDFKKNDNPYADNQPKRRLRQSERYDRKVQRLNRRGDKTKQKRR